MKTLHEQITSARTEETKVIILAIEQKRLANRKDAKNAVEAGKIDRQANDEIEDLLSYNN